MQIASQRECIVLKKKKKIALSFKFSKTVNDYADYPLGLKILQRQRNCSFRYKMDNVFWTLY